MDSTLLIIIAAVALLFMAIGLVAFIWLRRGNKSNDVADDMLNQPSSPDTTQFSVEAMTDTTRQNPNPIPVVDSPSLTDNFDSPLSSTPAPTMPALDPEEEGKIRIMIIDDNEETIHHVTRLLYFEDDVAVVGQANRGKLGIEMALQKQPHVILMDINMPDMDGIETTRRLSEQVPYSQVIMISVQSDQEYMKQAMLAGARDYQPKPFSSDELIESIRRVYDLAQSTYEQFQPGRVTRPASTPATSGTSAPSQTVGAAHQNGRVVAIYSPKGGVGTSTIAANLAVAMQQRQSHVVLVDADFQFGDIMVHLNTQAERSIADLVRSEAFELELLPEMIAIHSTGLNLLLAPAQPETAELITPAMTVETLNALRQRFETIIVDTTSFLSNQTLAILDTVDYVILVVEPELPSIKNAKLFLEVVQALNLSPDRIDLLINGANKEGGIGVKQIGQALQVPHTYQVPFDQTVLESINGGTVLVESQAKSAFSKGIATVADTMLAKLAIDQTDITVETA